MGWVEDFLGFLGLGIDFEMFFYYIKYGVGVFGQISGRGISGTYTGFCLNPVFNLYGVIIVTLAVYILPYNKANGCRFAINFGLAGEYVAINIIGFVDCINIYPVFDKGWSIFQQCNLAILSIVRHNTAGALSADCNIPPFFSIAMIPKHAFLLKPSYNPLPKTVAPSEGFYFGCTHR